MHKNAISGAVQASVATGGLPPQYSSDATNVRLHSNNMNMNIHNNMNIHGSNMSSSHPSLTEQGLMASLSNSNHSNVETSDNNALLAFGSSRSSPTRHPTIPIVYQISSHASSRAFSLTILLPKHRLTHMEATPLVLESSNHHHHNHNNHGGKETHIVRLAMAQMLQLHHETESSSNSNPPSWLDRTTLVTRLQKGGEAVGLSSSQWRDVMAVVEETAARLTAGWCPEGTESIQVELVVSEGIVTIVATVSSTPLPYVNSSSNSSGGAGTPSHSLYRNAFSISGSSPSSSSNNNHTNSMSSPSFARSVSAGGGNGVWTEPHGELLATAKPFPAPGSGIGGGGGGASSSSFSNSVIGSSDMPPNINQHGTPTPNRNPPSNANASRGFTRSYSMGSYGSSSSPSTPIGSIGSSHGGGGSTNNSNNNNNIFSSPRGGGSPYPNWFQQGADTNNSGTANARNFLQPHSNQQNQFRPPPMMNPGPSPPHVVVNHNHQSTSHRSSPQDGGNVQHWNASPKSLSSYHGSSSPRNWSRQNSGGLDGTTANSFSDPLPMMSPPDPLQIVEPLRAMGFSQRQCDAAVQAIRSVSMEESPHTTTAPIPVRSRFDSQSSFPGNSGGGDGGNDVRLSAQEGMYQIGGGGRERENRRNTTTIQNGNVPDQLTGEDILGFVLSSNNHEHSGKVLEHDRNSRRTSTNNDIVQMESTMRNLLARSDGSKESASRENKNNVWGMSSSSHLHHSPSQQDVQHVLSNEHPQPSVWGNAGKLKVVKSSSTAPGGNYHDANSVSEDSIADSASLGGSSQWAQPGYHPQQQQQQNLIKMLNIPPDLNAFVFHCNANTREECLQRGLFGCPSGGQYGPHSKAKKGDLLFLADFSAWTVTGIFTAACDAAMNIERSALGGKFPWQIRLSEWNDLRTVHIDKVNEIIGLASGSKLNMLSKDQLISLVTSKEFSPCVPPHLFKMVPMSAQTPKIYSTQIISPKGPINSNNFSDETKMPVIPSQSIGMNGVKYQKVTLNMSSYDEHPATAMHRLKLVTAWFDSMSSEIMTMNEMYNNKKSPRRSGQKERPILDEELLKVVRIGGNQSWPLMSFSHIRRAVADIFDKWLQYAHAVGSEETRTDRQTHFGGNSNLEGNWTRQRSSSSSGKVREDPVLLLHVPGASDQIQRLLQMNSGPSLLSIPTENMASALTSKLIREIELMSGEVRKTQSSLIKIGGDDYVKSVKDQSLGMHRNEEIIKCYNEGGEKVEKTIIRIEWHTKSSIAQGRPPQVQKIFKTHFDLLERNYKTVSGSTDTDSSHLLTRLFVLLCRYDLIGDIRSGNQVLVPPGAMKAMAQHFGVAHECFATPLNRICQSYNSFLFHDIDRHFGSLGPFFDFLPIEGSFQVNPPFGGDSLDLMLNHIFKLLHNSSSGTNALSFIIVINKSEEAALQNVKKSKFLRRVVSVESKSTFLGGILHKDSGPSSRKPKINDDGSALDFGTFWSIPGQTLLIWLQNDIAHNLWTPSDGNVMALMKRFE